MKDRMNTAGSRSLIFLSWFLSNAAALTQTTTIKQTRTAQFKHPSIISLPPSASLKRTGLCMSNSFHNNEVQRSLALLPALRQQQHMMPLTQQQRSKSTSIRSTATFSDAIKADDGKKRLAAGMAFLTGWANVTLFLKYKGFATMMTGNSFKLANALVDRRVRDVCLFVGLICSYMFGVGAFRRAELSFKNKSLHGLMAPLVAGAFIGSDYVGLIKPSCQFLPATMLAFAFGIINSIGTEVTGTLIFVVTGAMTRLSNMIVDRISRTAGRKKIPKEGALMSLSVIGGFILGAAWHTLLNKKAPELVSHGAASIIGGIYGLFFLWLDRVQIGCWWSGKDAELCLIDEEDCNY